MIAILTVFSIGALSAMQFPAGEWDWGQFRTGPFLTQLFAAAAYQLSWSMYVSDYSRYLPRDVSVRASFWWTYLGAFIGGAWMMLVGTIVTATAPKVNLAAAIEHASDLIFPGFGRVMLIGGMLGPDHHHVPEFLRRLADAVERGGHGEAVALHPGQARGQPRRSPSW